MDKKTMDDYFDAVAARQEILGLKMRVAALEAAVDLDLTDEATRKEFYAGLNKAIGPITESLGLSLESRADIDLVTHLLVAQFGL